MIFRQSVWYQIVLVFSLRLDWCSAHGVYFSAESFNSFLPFAPQLSKCQVKESWHNCLAS